MNSVADLDSGTHTGCHRVKQAYLREHIGPSDLVPSEPIYDRDISICFNAATKDPSEKNLLLQIVRAELCYSS